MGTLILPGDSLNILSRAESVTASETDASFPVSNLYDGRPERPWKGATASSSVKTISITAQFLKNGTLNNWSGGVPLFWRHNGTGTVTEDTSVKTEGTSAARLNTSQSAILSDPIVVRAGERLRIQGDVRVLAGGDQATVKVRSLRSGLTLASTNEWGGDTQIFTETSTTFQSKSLAFTVQDVEDLRGPSDLLEVILTASIDGAYFDNWWIIPETDFVSLHGHNFGSTLGSETGSALRDLEWRAADTTPPGTTIQAAIPLYSPALYHREPTPFFNKYHQIRFLQGEGGWDFTNIDPLEVGELVIGRAEQLIQNPSYGVELIEDWPQERQEVEGVTVQAFNLSRHPRRRVVLPFNTTTPTYEQVRDFLFRITRGGQDPVVIVPDDQRPEVVFGHITRGFEPSAVTFDRWAYDIVIEESPFAVPLS